MYSLIELTNDAGCHGGFYIFTVITSIWLVVAWWCWEDSPIMIALTLFGASVSFDPKNNIPMVNTPVTAKFVKYVAEEQTYKCGTKNMSTCYTSKVYGQFETPEGMVALEVNKNVPIPTYVTLYKN
jgi:hypothetical protein